ncbi:M15 family metallopeptidase [Paenibacillus spongiae]|uniref:M15 family metallopeptidase n=1 Tax=Paenibacillus spongiae TaxID=2909671 RepID=A0ABY5S9N6_9BACL|nr:M15 family metallopeptidase [Paenibacillus spongiae]UVI29250.1 M15 family metallopeptidase [Paenibacillus spongiae]
MQKSLFAIITLIALLILSACGHGTIPASPPGIGNGSDDTSVDSAKTAADKIQVPEAEAAIASLLINKDHPLPEDYKPDDLVYPDVKFTFLEKIEKRMMRKPASQALEKLFAAAAKDGLPLAGVSAYRSHDRQKQLFEAYVRKDGEAKARTYSAYPGTSEHETGLAIDVTGADGKCAATGCFGGTPEAKWLAKHAYEFGFIIRYPKGKEDITGYQYEPWHLRYVGPTAANTIYSHGWTLEEHAEAILVSTPTGNE